MRTVYTAECHTCMLLNRSDTWHEHQLWIADHNETPTNLYPYQTGTHNIHTYTQQWTPK